MDIKIDVTKKTGKIKPLHGINNGPVAMGELINVSKHYKEIEFPYVRLHDTNWPNPGEVDIHTIFRDFDKDPEKEENYDFRKTDAYIKSIVEIGAEIIFRLGTSIEHAKQKYYTHPPKDYKKWVKICIGIIRHYNEGWADGFYYNIKYWEIWNEPDGIPGTPADKCPMWSGTKDEYFQLYKLASTEIKKYNSNLSLGGYAAAMFDLEFLKDFLRFCKKEDLPLDFFSWHYYTKNPENFASNAILVRNLLDRYGFTKTESHFNEWNRIELDEASAALLYSENGGKLRQKIFSEMKSVEGSSFILATLLLLQDMPVDISNYYDGQYYSMFCGIFDYCGVPQKGFYSFKAFKQLYDLENRIYAKIDDSIRGLYCCSALSESGNDFVILISNYAAISKMYTIEIKNLPQKRNVVMEYHLLDRNHDLELVMTEYKSSEELKIEQFIELNAVLLVKGELSPAANN